ncbi:MAG: hypothetical protein K0S04_902 [Herbinix sp.]|nr:hypothetical protein [Herbinix sp.]
MLNAVDKYVIYDDVNFIKGGWINRNRILNNGSIVYFNVQMSGASSFKLINEIGVCNDAAIINKHLRIIEAAYKNAPYFFIVYPIIKDILECTESNLASYLVYSIKRIGSYLDINTELIISSSLNKNNALKAQDKVIDICKILGATEYYNAIGGHELYSNQKFLENNIKLKFVKTNNIEYTQAGQIFQPNLSIIDVMMFNSAEDIKRMLKCFELI